MLKLNLGILTLNENWKVDQYFFLLWPIFKLYTIKIILILKCIQINITLIKNNTLKPINLNAKTEFSHHNIIMYSLHFGK